MNFTNIFVYYFENELIRIENELYFINLLLNLFRNPSWSGRVSFTKEVPFPVNIGKFSLIAQIVKMVISECLFFVQNTFSLNLDLGAVILSDRILV